MAESLAHHQGDKFAALASPDSSNEEVYLLQQFTRAVMASPNINRLRTPAQIAVENATAAGLGRDVSNTNNPQELFTDVRAGLVVGPSIGPHRSRDLLLVLPLPALPGSKVRGDLRRGVPALPPGAALAEAQPGTTAILLEGIARQIVDLGLASTDLAAPELNDFTARLADRVLDDVASQTGCKPEDIVAAATLYATGLLGAPGPKPDAGYGPSLIYNTAAHLDAATDDPFGIAAACLNLAMLTGNLGRPGGAGWRRRAARQLSGRARHGGPSERVPRRG